MALKLRTCCINPQVPASPNKGIIWALKSLFIPGLQVLGILKLIPHSSRENIAHCNEGSNNPKQLKVYCWDPPQHDNAKYPLTTYPLGKTSQWYNSLVVRVKKVKVGYIRCFIFFHEATVGLFLEWQNSDPWKFDPWTVIEGQYDFRTK